MNISENQRENSSEKKEWSDPKKVKTEEYLLNLANCKFWVKIWEVVSDFV